MRQSLFSTKMNQKGNTTLIIIGIGVLLIVGFFIVLSRQNNKPASKQSSITPALIPADLQTPQLSIDDSLASSVPQYLSMTQTKIFNTQDQFTFKYPAGMKIDYQSYASGDAQGHIYYGRIYSPQAKPQPIDPPIHGLTSMGTVTK